MGSSSRTGEGAACSLALIELSERYIVPLSLAAHAHTRRTRVAGKVNAMLRCFG